MDAYFGIDESETEDFILIQNSEFKIQNWEGAYDLIGRKINSQLSPVNCHLKKGIYIVNGKKVIR